MSRCLLCQGVIALAVLLSLIGVPRIARASPPEHPHELTTYDEILQYIKDHPSSRMEELLEAVSPEIRRNVAMVYASRSNVGASLKNPRVIISNQDASLVLAFASDEGMQLGNQLEIMSTSPTTHQPQFTRILFDKGHAEIDESQLKCISCHGFKDVDGKVYMRPIMDDYPEWPGWFGSSHVYDGFNEFGASRVNRPAFEEKALSELNPDQPRLRVIPDLANYKNSSVAATAVSRLDGRLEIQNLARVLQRALDQASDPAALYNDLRVLAKASDQINVQDQEWNQGLGKTVNSHYEDKLSRYLDIEKQLSGDPPRQIKLSDVHYPKTREGPAVLNTYGTETRNREFLTGFESILKRHAVGIPDLAMTKTMPAVAPFLNGTFNGRTNAFQELDSGLNRFQDAFILRICGTDPACLRKLFKGEKGIPIENLFLDKYAKRAFDSTLSPELWEWFNFSSDDQQFLSDMAVRALSDPGKIRPIEIFRYKARRRAAGLLFRSDGEEATQKFMIEKFTPADWDTFVQQSDEAALGAMIRGSSPGSRYARKPNPEFFEKLATHLITQKTSGEEFGLGMDAVLKEIVRHPDVLGARFFQKILEQPLRASGLRQVGDELSEWKGPEAEHFREAAKIEDYDIRMTYLSEHVHLKLSATEYGVCVASELKQIVP